jgi:hypothetical protein
MVHGQRLPKLMLQVSATSGSCRHYMTSPSRHSNVPSGLAKRDFTHKFCVHMFSRTFYMSCSSHHQSHYSHLNEYKLAQCTLFIAPANFNHVWCGFGGLEDACWPLVPKFAGSNPAEAVGFFRAKKIPSAPFFGGEVKPAVPCCRFTAC